MSTYAQPSGNDNNNNNNDNNNNINKMFYMFIMASAAYVSTNFNKKK
jgi:hypothetical protein